MTDGLGWRATWGLLVPSTNTVAEPDFHRLAPAGITVHTSRIRLTEGSLADDAAAHRLMAEIRASTRAALEAVMTAEPDHLVMGMSAETFWDGRQGDLDFQARVHALTGRRITSPATACARALVVLGARRVAVLTPYPAALDTRMRAYLEECGHDVVAVEGLRCPTAVAIARQPTATLRAALGRLAGVRPDAIVQFGTNLPLLGLVEEAEAALGVPVVAINAVTCWQALRETGLTDRVAGYGRLLREH